MYTCHLLALPEELVAAISSFVSPDSILPFALTCTETYRHLKQRLEQNKQHHYLYNICHDRLPLTVPSLLRLAIRNPEAAWHIRAFDSWGIRPGFLKWKTWTYYDESDDENWPETAEDHSHLDAFFFNAQDHDDFSSILENSLHLIPQEADEWRSQVDKGWDEPLKAMFFAIAPRLDRLNFIAYDSWQGDEFHDDHPLVDLCQAISRLYGLIPNGVHWPPGFQTLREVSVCTSTDLRHPHDAYYAPPSAVAPLFFLPNIKALNLTLLGYSDDEDPEFNLPPRSSSVERLAFSCCDITLDALKKFVLAPRRLVAFSSSASAIEQDTIFQATLTSEHGQTLEHLSLDHYKDGIVQVCASYPHLRSLDRLKVSDLVKDSTSLNTLNFRGSRGSQLLNKKSSDVEVVELRDFLPPSLEKLGLVGNPAPIESQSTSAIQNQIIHAIADLVEDKRFSNLQEVCLYEMLGRPEEGGFPKCEAFQRIAAKGIDMHLRCEDGSAMRHSKHIHMHKDGNTGLTEIETDPRTPGEREY